MFTFLWLCLRDEHTHNIAIISSCILQYYDGVCMNEFIILNSTFGIINQILWAFYFNQRKKRISSSISFRQRQALFLQLNIPIISLVCVIQNRTKIVFFFEFHYQNWLKLGGSGVNIRETEDNALLKFICFE